MRVWSIGAGAVGGTIAARLARSGVEPVVIDANREHVLRMRHPGLRVNDDLTPLAAYTPDDLGDDAGDPPDVVLLAVRSGETEAALRPLVGLLGPSTDVVSLQNGLNEDRIAELAGAARTVGCMVAIAATWISPGHVELTAPGDIVIGRLDGSTDDRLEDVRALLDAAFPTQITDNIRGALWGKILVNSMTVLGALGGMLTGDVIGSTERRRIAAHVIAEGVDVATAERVRLPKALWTVDLDLVHRRGPGWEEALDEALKAVQPVLGPIKSVTLRDLELGRPTEIDAVTGEIVRRGESLGVDVPLNGAVYRMLKEIESGARAIDPANLASLAPVSHR